MADQKYRYKTEGFPIKLVDNGDSTYSLSVADTKQQEIELRNAPVYLTQEPQLLTIPTYEGSGQATHPSVIRERTRWNGYYFWMAFTPYPNTTHENPCIVASNDGVNWVVPNGLTNPLDPTPPTGYNSDTELVRVGDRLRVYWRWYTADGASGNVLYYMESSDGINWGTKKECTFDEYHDPISPAIVKTDKWYMYVGSNFKRFESTDGINWTNPVDCTTNADSVGRIWHQQVWADKNKLRMVAAMSSLGDSPATRTELFYGTSENGIDWTIEDNALYRRKAGSNFDERVYRSCVVPYPDSDGEMFIFMSGLTSSLSERIGYSKFKFND